MLLDTSAFAPPSRGVGACKAKRKKKGGGEHKYTHMPAMRIKLEKYCSVYNPIQLSFSLTIDSIVFACKFWRGISTRTS